MKYVNLSRFLDIILSLVNICLDGVNLVNSIFVSTNYQVKIILDVVLVAIDSFHDFWAYILERKTYGRKDKKRLIKMRIIFNMTFSGYDIVLEDVKEGDREENIVDWSFL